jgi:phosphatidylglycerol:prolipoprotein diacylglycerol transferase
VLRTLPQYLDDPSLLVSKGLLESAGDFYGGFLGALAAVAIFFWRNPDMKVWVLSDLCAPAIALGQGIGRIGCFMAGDDYGRETDVPWAVMFTDPEAHRIGGAPLYVPLHPVQLYESAFCFALFGLLVWLARRKRFDGQVILAYALLYAAGRFVIEYFRGDVDRGFVFGTALSTSQFIAILIAAVALGLYAVRSRRTAAAA